MLWADEDPQQFQSSSSIRLSPSFSHTFMSDSLLSLAVVAREHPGK
jgi:hypothetical protein